MTRLQLAQKQNAGPGAGLAGRLGTADLILATLAFAAPLAGTSGYISILISSGNGIGAPSAFLVMTPVLLLFAIGYGAMTRHVPNPGAFYAYITAGLGKHVGLGSAFMILGTYLLMAAGFYGFAGLVLADFVQSHGGPQIPWWLCAIGFWIIVGTLAYFKIEVSAKVLGVLLLLEVLIIAVFDIAVIGQGGAEGLKFDSFSVDALLGGSPGIALLFAACLFNGFEATAIYREETRDPDRTIPRATVLTVILIGAFYTVTSWALVTGLGSSQAVEKAAADPVGVFFTVAHTYGGQVLVDSANILVITSVLASHLAIQNVATRYVFSLGVDGILPKALGKAHPRFHSPHRASVSVSITIIILTAVMTIAGLAAEQIYAWFAGTAAFLLLVAMALTSLAVVLYFKRHPQHIVSSWKSFWAPLVAFMLMVGMVVLGTINFPTLIGGSDLLANIILGTMAAIFGIGMLTALVFRRTKPEVYARIGRQ